MHLFLGTTWFPICNSLKNTFTGKAINKATISFDIIEDADYPSHKSIYLFRETESGNIVFLTDFTIEGDEHFGGVLESFESKQIQTKKLG